MPYESWRLSEEFWSAFVRDYWEKKPTVIPRPFAKEIITHAEALDVLRRAGGPEAAHSQGGGFYVDGVAKELKPDYLPRPGEDSVAGFAGRLHDAHGLRNYQFTVYGTQLHNPEIWFRTRAAFGPLYDLVGIPAVTFNTDIFFGEYLVTAAGLHKDNAAVFSYVVHGAKTMLAWPFEYFAAEARTPEARRTKAELKHVDHTKHLEAAVELQGQPGDLLYWPSTYWHVAVGDGKPHMTFNMSPYFPTRTSRWTERIISPMLVEALGPHDWTATFPYKRADLQQLAQGLPASIEKTLATFQAVLGSQRLRSRLMVAWLGVLTGFGFSAELLPRPDSAARLSEGTRYAGDPDYPAVHVALGESQELVAANGFPFLARKGPALDHVLAAANGGEAFTVEAVAARAAESADGSEAAAEALREQVTAYLQKLLVARAIRPVAVDPTG